MKRKLPKILVGVAFILVGLFIIIATRPDTFSVTRTITINAWPSLVFEQVNDLHKFQDWSPWAKRDPAAKIVFTGPDAGPGAAFSWEGNRDVGAGSMTLTENRLNEQIRYRLDFLKPFKGTSDAEFNFKPDGNQTVVLWTMSGKNNFIAKGISLFIDCDKMIGDDFDKGLANLKALCEAPLPNPKSE